MIKTSVQTLIDKVDLANIDTLEAAIDESAAYIRDRKVTLHDAGRLNHVMGRKVSRFQARLTNAKTKFRESIRLQLELLNTEDQIQLTPQKRNDHPVL